MAKYEIVYSCGHDGEVQLYGPHKARERTIEWLENSCLCKKCQNEVIAKQNASEGMPKLKGTPKQIAWAEKIRQTINVDLQVLRDIIAQGDNPNSDPKVVKTLRNIVNNVMAHKNSSWWIDNRDKYFDRQWLANEYKKIMDQN